MYYDGLGCTLIWHSLCRHSKEISRLLQEPSVDSNYYERTLFWNRCPAESAGVWGEDINDEADPFDFTRRTMHC